MADLVVQEVVKTAVIPAAAVWVACAVGSGRKDSIRSLLVGAGLAAGYGVSHSLIAGVPEVPPAESLQWFPLIAGGAWLWSLVVSRVPRGASWIPWMLGAGLVAWALIGRLTYSDPKVEWSWIGGSALLLFALWGPGIKERPASSSVGVLAVVAGVAAGVAILNHSAKISQLGGVLGAGLGAAALLQWWRPNGRVTRDLLRVGQAVMGALVIYLDRYLETPPRELCFLVAAWAVAHLESLPKVRAMSPRRSLVVLTLFAGLLGAVAILFGYLRRQAEPANPYGY